ncbi:uncharacterized protein LOC116411542 [Xenopus tropicalis]|uniref:Uncharacterized protein LOC116411542 n=1 Tax=Xenopus tropicalis TaxID=8364 RepID=A0A8J1JS73_XENTR|nr:uncharacterized protein LOC116411542 [Xenopus tropicalis]
MPVYLVFSYLQHFLYSKMLIDAIYAFFNNLYICIIILLAIFTIFGFRHLAILMDSLDIPKNEKKQTSRGRQSKTCKFRMKRISDSKHKQHVDQLELYGTVKDWRELHFFPAEDSFFKVIKRQLYSGIDMAYEQELTMIFGSINLRINVNEFSQNLPCTFRKEELWSRIIQEAFGQNSAQILQHCLPFLMANRFNSHALEIADIASSGEKIEFLPLSREMPIRSVSSGPLEEFSSKAKQKKHFRSSYLRFKNTLSSKNQFKTNFTPSCIKKDIFYNAFLYAEIRSAQKQENRITQVTADGTNPPFLPFNGELPIRPVSRGLLEKILDKEMQKKKCTSYLRFHNKPYFKYGLNRNEHNISCYAFLYANIKRAQKEDETWLDRTDDFKRKRSLCVKMIKDSYPKDKNAAAVKDMKNVPTENSTNIFKVRDTTLCSMETYANNDCCSNKSALKKMMKLLEENTTTSKNKIGYAIPSDLACSKQIRVKALTSTTKRSEKIQAENSMNTDNTTEETCTSELKPKMDCSSNTSTVQNMERFPAENSTKKLKNKPKKSKKDHGETTVNTDKPIPADSKSAKNSNESKKNVSEERMFPVIKANRNLAINNTNTLVQVARFFKKIFDPSRK